MTCQGTVKSFNFKQGYGFISYGDKDVFVHMRDCGSAVPQAGDQVTFDLEDSPSKPGQHKAANVVGGTGTMSNGKGGGKAAAKGTGAYFGVVKSFHGLKAWGFIAHEGEDLFVHLKDMVDGTTPQAGDQVQFDLEDNPAKPGSMKAKNCTGGTGWPEDEKGKGKGKGKDDYGKGKGGYDSWGGGGWGGAMDMIKGALASKGGWGPYGGDWGKGDSWGKGDWGKGDWGKGDWGKGSYGGDWGKGGKMAKGGW